MSSFFLFVCLLFNCFGKTILQQLIGRSKVQGGNWKGKGANEMLELEE